MTVINATTVFLHNRWKSKLYAFVSRKPFIAFGTTTPAANRIAFVRYPGIENLGIVVMAEGAAQCLLSLLLSADLAVNREALSEL